MKRLSLVLAAVSVLCAGPVLLLETVPYSGFPLAAAGSMSKEIVNAHNKYRSELNVPPLIWSDKLASDAMKWANHLSRMGGRRLVHSSRSSRRGQGENLWMGTAGYYSYTDMVNAWGSEKRYFKYGTFPRVSTTGNWASVGHYTQIIWSTTKEVGCALARAGGMEILVCRYSPPGNYIGRKPY